MTELIKACPAKVVRDGKVAVLVSSDFGIGFYSATDDPACLFCPEIVAMLERSAPLAELLEFVKARWPRVHRSAVQDLNIEWVPEGAAFCIREYDGAEWVELRDDVAWVTA